MGRALVIVSAGVAMFAAYLYVQQRDAASAATSADDSADTGNILDTIQEGIDTMTNAVKSIGYTYEKVPVQYRYAIGMAEMGNALPDQLLARLLYQESRYRPEIIDGSVRSPAGAIGIAQFMPATAKEWNVNPLDPYSSIQGAGRYLAWLHKQTGSWARALAAYNWGVGNVKRNGIESAPLETRNYFSQILSDIGLA